ncbi:hydroxysqualene dehydroxylase HpnE [Alcaligenaceae bacterium CGII-47]|nr:hydroxysqualene dehydroxylase HpnE [Alcaligenaceae bacterium CGII-47]
MRIAVIGAGWAGLAAALRAQDRGFHPVVIEAARVPGGRARCLQSNALDTEIDNGQHILLGAYTETLALMRRLGIPIQTAFCEQTLHLESADKQFRLRAWPLPAPWHQLGAILGARGLSLGQRLHTIRLLSALKGADWRTPNRITVTQWLAGHATSTPLIERIWAPLCLATMNTPLDLADAQLFAHVLRDSLGAHAAASRVLIPRGTLNQLWPEQACKQLPEVRLGQHVQAIHTDGSGYRVDDEPFDGVIVATPPHASQRLLAALALPDAQADWWDAWPDWHYEAIGTVSLRLAQPWRLPHPMLMLWEHPTRQQFGQWLFDRSVSGRGSSDDLLHIVISQASRTAHLTAIEVIAGVTQQLREQVARPLPTVVAQTLVTEKRATFSAVPGLRRPQTRTPWPNLLLAGDWTDTGYPAVLEGAVRSGLAAADQLGI